ncbi:aminotransferase class III-fold pyridoxal phosphate-dependent enzyme [Sphingosinicella soli]|uniref:Adenosylmethionine-8-amino-7-oxononanoate aminotransferase n=1 Tax=Sphingosinicella soli TaxID=333708 RepID=A0A7W7B4T4_9SPHN|nr:adenosylmethionine-8-amino-7-oxononanoate aminotransferase [Sphingosinicella soli]
MDRIIGSRSTQASVKSGVQDFFLPVGAQRPPTIESAEGIYYFDASGRRYLDASSGPVAVNIGHGNPRIHEAIANQARKAAFAFPLSFQSEANLHFTEALLALAGPGYDHVYVTSGGSEAVETCMKFARVHAVRTGQPQRRHFISLDPSYHGATLGAMSLTGDASMAALFDPIMAAGNRVPAPLTYRLPEGETAETYARTCLRALEERIAVLGAETVLGLVVEPISGLSSGANVAPDLYYAGIREICTRHDILLIYDEVLSGSGRTGKMFGFEHWPDHKPDLVALSKGISSGYFPVGAMLAPAHMVKAVAETGGFPHAQTYTTTPLACAAGAAVLKEITSNGLIDNARLMGDRLRAGLERLMAISPVVGDVRGRGLLLAIEIVQDQATKRSFPFERNAVGELGRIGMEEGIALYPRRTNGGIFGEWLMITPPIIISDTQVDELLSRLEATLKRFAA